MLFSLDLHLDIKVSNQWHPNQRRRSKRKRKNLRQSKRHALEDKQLASKMHQRHRIRRNRHIVHGPNVQVIRSVAPHDTSDERPCPKEPSRKGRELVRRLGVGGWRGDELVGGVVRVVG